MSREEIEEQSCLAALLVQLKEAHAPVDNAKAVRSLREANGDVSKAAALLKADAVCL